MAEKKTITRLTGDRGRLKRHLKDIELDLNNAKRQATEPQNSEAFRARFKAQYTELLKQKEAAKKDLLELEKNITKLKTEPVKLDKEQGTKDASIIEEKYSLLKQAYEIDNDPAVKKQMDALAKDYQSAYSNKIGTTVSLAVAKSNLETGTVPSFGTPTGTTPPAGPADATKRGTEAVAKTGDIPATPGKSKVPNAPKTPKTPLPTAAEKEAEALGVAAGPDFTLPETIFKNVPSLQRLLQKYSDPKLGMTQNQFLKELRDDVWYKKNSTEIKNRYIQLYNYRDLKASGQADGSTDYEKQIATITRQLSDKAKAIGSGIASDPEALARAAENMYITNQGIDDAMTTDFLAAAIRPIGSTIGGKATSGYSGQALQNYQTLQAAAKANGFSIADIIPGGSNEQQVLAGIATGAIDINRVAQDARKLAAQGQPQYVRDLLGQGYNLDQVYAPYRQTMASILEVQDPNQIDLNDPTLRMAITDKGDMNLYDFKKALKKDNRWQYTENARQEVSTAAFNVLRDFGFQG